MEETEARIRELHDGGATDEAVTLVVETYGSEVFGFLVSRFRDDDTATEAFAQTCEDLVASMRSFGWRCSMRTWMYKLARSAATKQTRGLRKKRGEVPLSQASEVAEKLSSRTRDWLRTEVKDAFSDLRAELAPEDQTLLILRVDRALEWNEIADVSSDEDLDDHARTREAARLRQRFKSVKEELRRRAIETGLIAQDDESSSNVGPTKRTP
jgi:RNA polymerase sigma-70 factor, ECF subfamily